MKGAHPVRIAVQHLVIRGSVLAAAVWLCILMISQAEHDKADSPPDAAPMIEPSLVGGTAQMAMNIPEGRISSRYSMRDEEGRESVLLTYNRSGAVDILLGEPFPVRAACRTTPEGHYILGVEQDGLNYKLEIKPDGSSDYSVIRGADNVRERLRLSPDGQSTHEHADAY